MGIMYIKSDDPKVLELAQTAYGIYSGVQKQKSDEKRNEIDSENQAIDRKIRSEQLSKMQQENAPVSEPEKQSYQKLGISLPKDMTRGQLKEQENVLLATIKARQEQNKEKAPTSDQGKAATYAKRMEQAEFNFGELSGSGYDRTNVVNASMDYLTPESKLSPERKKQDQAERNFLSAVLRRESGASISPNEREEGALQYFSRAGDTPDVLEQKRQNRLLAIEGIKTEAGGAYKKLDSNFQQPQIAKGMVRANVQQAGFGGNSKPKTVIQGGHTFTLNPKTGQYE